jgi:hypothetical protein
MSCHVMAVLRCGVAASAAVGPGGSPLGGVVSVGRGVFVSWAQAGIDGAHLQRVLVAGGGLPRGARILNLVTRNRRDVDTISATMDLIKDGHGPLTWQAKNLPLFSISSRTSLRTASCVQYLCCTRDRHSVYRCRPTHCGTSCLPAPPPPKRRCTVALNIRPLSGGGAHSRNSSLTNPGPANSTHLTAAKSTCCRIATKVFSKKDFTCHHRRRQQHK